MPSCVPPSKNVIVPVGVPEPEAGETFAVKLTFAPMAICAADALSAVVVEILDGAATVTEMMLEVEAAKSASPE